MPPHDHLNSAPVHRMDLQYGASHDFIKLYGDACLPSPLPSYVYVTTDLALRFVASRWRTSSLAPLMRWDCRSHFRQQFATTSMFDRINQFIIASSMYHWYTLTPRAPGLTLHGEEESNRGMMHDALTSASRRTGS